MNGILEIEMKAQVDIDQGGKRGISAGHSKGQNARQGGWFSQTGERSASFS